VTDSFVPSLYIPERRLTRVVKVGDVAVGGENPIRVQSMTTTDTLDTTGTADQVVELVEAGCEIVRITAPSIKEAENLASIRAELDRRKIRVPLVADIHFTPRAALVAVEHVDKIRINPGNFADKKKFEIREYDDAQYAEELERVAARFRPLVRRCRELGRSMRIGTNHGSLADRIMNRYGDTPRGMVESALEFLDVCEDEGFYEVIFSMKASNPRVAVHAYRLLAAKLEERSRAVSGESGFLTPGYPFHVGVTEAGDGEDGRVKSAIGIGALLLDGLGDTIRVSLTEHPAKEIPVAVALARSCEARWRQGKPGIEERSLFLDDPYAHQRRHTRSVQVDDAKLGGPEPVRVEIDLGPLPVDPETTARELDEARQRFPRLVCEGLGVEIYDDADRDLLHSLRRALADLGLRIPLVVRAETRSAQGFQESCDRLVVPVGRLIDDAGMLEIAREAAASGKSLEWELRGDPEEIPTLVDRALRASNDAALEDFLFSVDVLLPVHAIRLVCARLRARGAADTPIVLRYRKPTSLSDEEAQLEASIDVGAPLCDGIGDAVVLAGFPTASSALNLAYRILQGSRLRSTRTEFISCPSCGRTLFDLEETTARIKARTDHLVGVKIAIMGCIVNGPGEMADADFGYVGSGPGSVNLFVGKECVERHVPSAEADERLIALIQSHGAWQEPD